MTMIEYDLACFVRAEKKGSCDVWVVCAAASERARGDYTIHAIEMKEATRISNG